MGCVRLLTLIGGLVLAACAVGPRPIVEAPPGGGGGPRLASRGATIELNAEGVVTPQGDAWIAAPSGSATVHMAADDDPRPRVLWLRGRGPARDWLPQQVVTELRTGSQSDWSWDLPPGDYELSLVGGERRPVVLRVR